MQLSPTPGVHVGLVVAFAFPPSLATEALDGDVRLDLNPGLDAVRMVLDQRMRSACQRYALRKL